MSVAAWMMDDESFSSFETASWGTSVATDMLMSTRATSRVDPRSEEAWFGIEPRHRSIGPKQYPYLYYDYLLRNSSNLPRKLLALLGNAV